MYDHRVECSLRYWFDVMCVKVVLAATPGTPPSVPFKRLEAIEEIDFVVLRRDGLNDWCFSHRAFFAVDGRDMAPNDIGVLD